MFTAISSFEIANGMENEVKDTFKNRPKQVENFEGFIRMDVLNPAQNPAQVWLLTQWKDKKSFTEWHHNHLKQSHGGIPKGLKLVPHSFSLRFFDHITS